jgi:hypothetical protein
MLQRECVCTTAVVGQLERRAAVRRDHVEHIVVQLAFVLPLIY